jgi:putative MFS transporter
MTTELAWSDQTTLFSMNPPTIASRVERLPICGVHFRFIGLVSIGTWLDFFDLFMVGYLGAALQNFHFLTLHQFSELVAAGFVGMFIGTIIQGLASDYIGRRNGFIITLLIYSISSVLGAFSPNAAMLIAMRFVAGIGLSGQQVVVDTFISEMIPSHSRGRYVAISQVIGFGAVPVAAYISSLLVPTHWLLDGWRWVMVIGGAGGLFAWVLVHWIQESPRWLESRGRVEEADRIVTQMEEEVERLTGKPLPPPRPVLVASAHRTPVRELWGPKYRSRTIMLVVFNLLQAVGFYGFANWAPTFILREGNSIAQSLRFGFLIAIAMPFGPLVAVFTTERFERKRTLILLSLLIASVGMVFALVRSPLGLVAVGALEIMLTSWFSSVYHAYQAELFPTRARATGVGFVYSWSRVGGFFSTFVIGALLVYGVPIVFVFLATCMVGVAIVVGFWGPKTNAIALEDLSA